MRIFVFIREVKAADLKVADRYCALPLFSSFCIFDSFFGVVRCVDHTRSEQKRVSAKRKAKLKAEKSARYFPVLFGYFEENSFKVMRLAREAMGVPVPPILTPSSNAR